VEKMHVEEGETDLGESKRENKLLAYLVTLLTSMPFAGIGSEGKLG
jgi:hypothetical protein